MDVVEGYQGMLDRFNRKRELHHRAHTLYKNRDMKVFTIPLMAVQLINAILPQISQALPLYDKLLGIIASTLAAIFYCLKPLKHHRAWCKWLLLSPIFWVG